MTPNLQKFFLRDSAFATLEQNYAKVEIFSTDVNFTTNNPEKTRIASIKNGIKVAFSQSIFYKNYTLVVTPKALLKTSPEQKTATITLKFASEETKVDGKRVEALSKFKNLKVNGAPLFYTKSTSFAEPFTHALTFSLPKLQQNSTQTTETTQTTQTTTQKTTNATPQTIKIEFSVKKPLYFSKLFRWTNLMLAIVLIFSVPFVWIKFEISQKLSKSKFNATDLATHLWTNYKNIDKVYRHSFWIIFAVLNVVFGYLTVSFLWGNHDWDFLISGSLTGDGLNYSKYIAKVGRYGTYAFNDLFTNGAVLPIFSTVVSILAMSLCAIFLCKLWQIPEKIWAYSITGLLFFCNPFPLSRFFYMHEIPSFFIAIMCGVLAILLNKNGSILKSIIGSVLIHFMMSVHQSLATVPLMALCGALFVSSLQPNSLKEILTKFKFAFLAVGFGFISFLFVRQILKYFGFYATSYNNEFVSFEGLLSKFITIIKESFEQIFSYNFAFMSNFATCFFAFCFCATVFILLQKRKFISIFLLFITLLTTKFIYLTAQYNLGLSPRIDIGGLLFFRILCVVALLILTKNIVSNLVFLCGIVAVFFSSIGVFEATKVWNLALEADKMLFNRIITRLEPNLKPNQKYTLVTFGNVPNNKAFRLATHANKKGWEMTNLLDRF